VGNLTICFFVSLLGQNQAAVIPRIAPNHTGRAS
jgi:hypothetical protein